MSLKQRIEYNTAAISVEITHCGLNMEGSGKVPHTSCVNVPPHDEGLHETHDMRLRMGACTVELLYSPATLFHFIKPQKQFTFGTHPSSRNGGFHGIYTSQYI